MCLLPMLLPLPLLLGSREEEKEDERREAALTAFEELFLNGFQHVGQVRHT